MSTFSDALKQGFLDALGESEEALRESSDPRETDSFTKRVAMFAKLENLKRSLKEALDNCTKASEKIGEELMEDMAEEGLRTINAHGLSIYPLESPYVSKRSDADGATKEAICLALKNNGLEYLVKNEDTYAPGALKKAVLELIDSGREVPYELKSLLNIGKTVKLTSRKSG